MNNDLISRKVAIAAVSYCGEITACEARAEIMALPAVDAELVRHGRWVKHKPNGIIWTLKCNECGWVDNRVTLNDKFNYCPNCGAKMDGEKHEID